MMYGYGEDALTLYTMTRGLRSFLDQLNDSTPENEAIVYFRPSFGRRSPNPKARPSVFGEFDAIVSTSFAVYLVEGKWNSSAELEDTTLTVAERQCRRHKVFRWYHDNWKKMMPTSWAKFRSDTKESFESTFQKLTIPTSGTTLAKNLEFILTSVCKRDLPLVDVLLFSTVYQKTFSSLTVNPPEFKLVVINAKSIGGSGYIEL